MFELTELQRQELSVHEPVAVDPQTLETYVLVRRETYERFKGSCPFYEFGVSRANGLW